MFWCAIARDRLSDPEPAESAKAPRPDDFGELLALFARTSHDLAEVLETTPPETVAWTWFERDQTVGFIRRRQAHEAVIHRIDAEQTASVESASIPTELAADGVDEVLHAMFGGDSPSWGTLDLSGAAGIIRLSDIGRSWPVRLGRFQGTSPNTGITYDEVALRVVPDGPDQTFVVDGDAAEVYRWLWNRCPIDTVALTGAPDACAHLLDLITQGSSSRRWLVTFLRREEPCWSGRRAVRHRRLRRRVARRSRSAAAFRAKSVRLPRSRAQCCSRV